LEFKVFLISLVADFVVLDLTFIGEAVWIMGPISEIAGSDPSITHLRARNLVTLTAVEMHSSLDRRTGSIEKQHHVDFLGHASTLEAIVQIYSE